MGRKVANGSKKATVAVRIVRCGHKHEVTFVNTEQHLIDSSDSGYGFCVGTELPRAMNIAG